jgi:copper chaperone CopZ
MKGKKMKKILFSLIVLVALNSAAYASNCHDGDHTAGHSHEDGKATGLSSGIKSENIIDVATNGMVCDFCAQAIEKVFMKREDVQGINVDLDNQKVVIYLKDNASIEDAEIVKLFEDSGYGVDKINKTS